MTGDRAALGTGSRRRYSAELQAQVMAECDASGASVAKVAMLPSTDLRDIQIQLRRGTTTTTITWPVSAAADFGAWMRELLR